MKNLCTFFVLCWLAAGTALFGQTPTVTIKDASGGEQLDINCANPVANPVNLSAVLPQIKHTDRYTVEKSSAYNPYAFTAGTKQNDNQKDNNRFFKSIPIGFDFCFYDQKYSSVVLGSNGVISFDPTMLNQVIFNFSQKNPNSFLPPSAVFGAMQEGLFFDDQAQSGIYTQLVGAAPFRKLVISYYNARLNYNGPTQGCENLRATTQIVLNETSNIIEVYLDEKPKPCGDSVFQNALVGIMNQSGTAGESPAGRNTGVWQAEKEAYAFVPSGYSHEASSLTWTDSSGKILGNQQNLAYTVTKSELIKLTAAYNVCGNETEVSDTFPITVDPEYPLARDLQKIYCEAGITVNLASLLPEVSSGNISAFRARFYKSLAEAQSGIGTTYDNTVLDASQVYYVRLESAANPACFTTSVLKLDLLSTALLKNSVDICAAYQSNYALAKLRELGIIDPNFTGKIEYYLAESGGSPVETLNLTNGQQLWLKFDGCPNRVGPITINLINGPAVNSPLTIPLTLCDEDADNTEPYDFSLLNSQIIANPSAYSIRYFYSRDWALAADPPADVEAKKISSGQNKIFVRVQDLSGGCISIAELTLDVTFTKTEAIDKDVFICYDGQQDFDINLADPRYSQGMAAGLTPVYYLKFDDAVDQKNPVTTVRLTENGAFTTETIYARFEKDGCRNIRQLRFHLVHIEAAIARREVCDNYNDGTENIRLADYDYYFFNGQNVSVKYFDAAGNQISNLTVGAGDNTVKYTATSNYTFIDGTPCTSSGTVTFVLKQAPVVKPSLDISLSGLCDNNSNGYELFDATAQSANLVSDPSQYYYEYYGAYSSTTGIYSDPIPDPRNIKIYDNTPKKIFVKVYSAGGCYAVSELNVTYVFSGQKITVHPAKLEQCSLSNQIVYNLDDAIPQIYIQSDNTLALSDVKFRYYQNYDATSETVSGELPSPNNMFSTGRSAIRVYAKIEHSNGCYSVVPIDLITYLSPVPNTTVQNFCKYDGVLVNTYTDGRLLASGNFDTTATYNYLFYSEDPTQNPNAAQIDQTKTFYPANGQKIWFKVDVKSNNTANCSAFGNLIFNESPQIAMTPLATIDNICDTANDLKETISLRQREQEIKAQYADAVFTYYTKFPDAPIANPDAYAFDQNIQDYVWVKISSSQGCATLQKLQIKLKMTPSFSITSPLYFCESQGGVELYPNYNFNLINNLNITAYDWTMPDGTHLDTKSVFAEKPGTYHLKITAENGCTYENDIVLKPYPTPTITQVKVNDRTITVYATGGDYSNPIYYQMDGGEWQASPVFNNVEPGVHEFAVRYDISSCPSAVTKNLVLTGVNVVTPNDDGYNDKITIGNLDIFDGASSLRIFDRYSKLVFEQNSSTSLVWDGKYNGRPLPTASYWYILKLPDGRELTGWFLVKNRD